MDKNIEKMKYLQIEHLPNSIAQLRQQTQDFNAQLEDLHKVRVNLEVKAEPILSGFYQVSDVNAKLFESQTISQKKLDEAVYKSSEMQKLNTVPADKVKDYTMKCKEERESLVHWMSEWGERVTELSKRFLHNSKLFDKDDLSEDVNSKIAETEEFIQKINEAQITCNQLMKQKDELESDISDNNTCLRFLTSDEAALATSLLKELVEEQKDEHIRNRTLLEEKQELEKWISENQQSSRP